jgi:hypothetical protein
VPASDAGDGKGLEGYPQKIKRLGCVDGYPELIGQDWIS